MEKEKSRMMDFRTEVKVGKGAIKLLPSHRMLFVGSCFADNLGKRFVENRFRAVVNPYGVMYNPTSVFHSVERYLKGDAFTQGENLPKEERRPDVAFFTLGTNHVYILKETGEVVDNCQKRPQRLFEEKELTVGECVVELSKAVWAGGCGYPAHHRHGESNPLCEVWIPWKSTLQGYASLGCRPSLSAIPRAGELFPCLRDCE